MPNETQFPLFKRGLMGYDMAQYYAQNTEVWVYGTPQEYCNFRDRLLNNREPKRIVADERGGMDVLVLPPATTATSDFVVIHERIVGQNGRINMELIIGGSQAGLALLADYFDRAVERLALDPDEHLHFDADEALLVLPSVYLNIRGPAEDIVEQLPELAPPRQNDLPPNVDATGPDYWGYTELSYKDLFGRIPIK